MPPNLSFVVPSSLSVYCIFYFPAFVQFSNLDVKLKEIFRDLELKYFFMININFAQSGAFQKVIMTCPNLATKINNNLILQLFMSNYCCNFIVLYKNMFLLHTFLKAELGDKLIWSRRQMQRNKQYLMDVASVPLLISLRNVWTMEMLKCSAREIFSLLLSRMLMAAVLYPTIKIMKDWILKTLPQCILGCIWKDIF